VQAVSEAIGGVVHAHRCTPLGPLAQQTTEKRPFARHQNACLWAQAFSWNFQWKELGADAFNPARYNASFVGTRRDRDGAVNVILATWGLQLSQLLERSANIQISTSSLAP
jgi:hypothetical protein